MDPLELLDSKHACHALLKPLALSISNRTALSRQLPARWAGILGVLRMSNGISIISISVA